MRVSANTLATVLVSAMALGLPQASAQTWPTHNITAIIPFAAGNANDITARIVLEQVGKQLGQPIIIDNRGGAGGTIGAGQGARVETYDCDGGTNQAWALVNVTGGVSVVSGNGGGSLCLAPCAPA